MSSVKDKMATANLESDFACQSLVNIIRITEMTSHLDHGNVEICMIHLEIVYSKIVFTPKPAIFNSAKQLEKNFFFLNKKNIKINKNR